MIYRYDGAPPSVSAHGFTGTSTDGTTVTQTSIDFGTASSTRRLVCAIFYGGSNILSAVTIGGVAATRLVGVVVSSTVRLELWIASVPTGTSGSVAVTSSTTIENPSVAIVAIKYLRSAAAIDTSTDTVGTISLSIDIESRGVVVACAGTVSGGAPGDASWTGATEVIEFTNPEQAGYRLSVATYLANSAETNRSISASGFNGVICGCAASFR